MSTPTKSLEAAIISGKLRHEGTQCMRWQIGSAIITRDPADNIKVVKNRNKKGQMVDGVVASIMAYGEHLKNRETGATLEVISL
jgi:phage terminase large subunit-like protein